MRIYPGTTVDYEFATLGGLGYTGTLNDRQFAALRAEGLTGSLPDMFKQFDGTLGGGGPTLSEQVEAMLSGTDGYVIPLRSTDQLKQDPAGTIAVTAASDPIGRIDTLYGNTAHNFQTTTDPFRAAWSGLGAAIADGTDDWMQGSAAALTVFQNKPNFYVCGRGQWNAFPGASFGIGFGNNPLCRFDVQADGSVRVQSRRAVASTTTTTVTSAAGIITVGVAFTYEVEIDFATTGTINVYINGVSVATGTLDDAPANSDSANITRNYIFRSNNNTAVYANMRFGDHVFTQRAMLAGERTICRAYVEEIGL